MASEAKDAKAVFVVHGRNEPLRKSMFDFLRAVGLHPLEWTEAVNLTGEGSPYVGTVLDAAFQHAQAVVVLLTPDEVTYLRPDIVGPDDPETQPSTQARPNVLFEAGMAFGHNAKHTVIVEVGSMRPFSDVGGRHTIHLANDAKSRQVFVERLRTAECDVATAGTDWLEVGDFTPPGEPGGGLPLGRRVPSAAVARPEVDFDVKYVNKGGTKIDKLQVINRGIGTAYDVTLALPEGAALQWTDSNTFPIAKIPGGGKFVTINAMSLLRFFGGHEKLVAFDINVRGRTESGQQVEQDVFIDLNG
jgi:hypothetical protein